MLENKVFSNFAGIMDSDDPKGKKKVGMSLLSYETCL